MGFKRIVKGIAAHLPGPARFANFTDDDFKTRAVYVLAREKA